MTSRPQLAAQRRDLTGKAVARLRRSGRLPAVVYGHGQSSEAIDLDAREFDLLRRRAGRHALVDLQLDGGQPRPVMVHQIQEHPVQRRALHVDFYVVKMTEEMTVDVPIATVGESEAAEKLGGTLLHLIESVNVRALPGDLPQSLELDITPLDSFDAVLHVSDLVIPPGVTLVTDPEEPVARVQPPRVEEEEEVPEAGEEGAEPEETAEDGAGAQSGASEGGDAES